jgi:GTPase SAR1 family protein
MNTNDEFQYIKRLADEYLEEYISHRENCFVVGPEASGKTALINRAIHLITETDLPFFPLRISMRECNCIDSSYTEVLASVLSALLSALDIDIDEIENIWTHPYESSFIKVIEYLVSNRLDKNLVIFVDEMEHLNPEYQEDFVTLMRYLNNCELLTCILVFDSKGMNSELIEDTPVINLIPFEV